MTVLTSYLTRLQGAWLAQRAAHPALVRWLGVLLTILLAGGGLWLSARGVRASSLVHTLAGVEWGWVALAAVASVVSILAQSWAWQLGLRAGGVGQVPLRHVASATWIGKAANTVLPGRVGALACIAVVGRHAPEATGRITRIVGSLVAQRVLAALATFLTVVASALCLPLPVTIPGGRWAPLAALLSLAAVLLVSRRVRIGQRARRIVPRRLRGVAAGLADGAGLLRPSRDAAGALVLQVVALGAQIATMGLLLRAFDIHAPVSAPLLLVALVAIAGVVPSAGGLGVNQVAIVAPLGASYGVPASSALAFSLGLQGTVAVVAVAGGLAALVHQRLAHPARARAVATA